MWQRWTCQISNSARGRKAEHDKITPRSPPLKEATIAAVTMRILKLRRARTTWESDEHVHDKGLD